MSDSCARNSRLVNNTSTMPVELTKLVMSASVTVRPIVLNCRPTGKSSKKKPRPTVSTRCSPVFGGAAASAPTLPRLRRGSLPPPHAGEGWGWGLDHALRLQCCDLLRRQPEPVAIDLGIVLADTRARPG